MFNAFVLVVASALLLIDNFTTWCSDIGLDAERIAIYLIIVVVGLINMSNNDDDKDIDRHNEEVDRHNEEVDRHNNEC